MLRSLTCLLPLRHHLISCGTNSALEPVPKSTLDAVLAAASSSKGAAATSDAALLAAVATNVPFPALTGAALDAYNAAPAPQQRKAGAGQVLLTWLNHHRDDFEEKVKRKHHHGSVERPFVAAMIKVHWWLSRFVAPSLYL